MAKSVFFKRSALVAAVSAATTASLSVPVAAQSERRVSMLEEVVVTARKRGDEVLQDIPATITAISGDTLTRLGAFDFTGFAYQVPGLTFNDEGAGQKRYVVRGIRSAGQEQVAVYYDEVPLPGIQGASGDSGSQTTDLKLFDMERIEVLKGPQGTTFGANSQIGTLRFIMNKPQMNEFDARVNVRGNKVEHGGWGNNAYGMVNVPIVDDTLALRLVAYTDKDAGFIDNDRLGLSNYNWYKTQGLRGMLRWEPNERVTVDAMAWVQKRKNGGTDRFNPAPSFSDSPDNLDFVNNALQPLQEIRDIARAETGDLKNIDFAQSKMPDDQAIYALTLNWDLDFAALTAAANYYDRDFEFKRDSTWVILQQGGRPLSSPNPNRPDLIPALTDQRQDIQQKSLEIRLNSTTDSPLQWMAGVFYRERDSGFRSFVPVVDPVTGAVFNPGPPTGFITGAPGEGIEDCNPCAFARVNQRTIDERAVFGEVSYELTDRLEIMGGLRWFEADQSDVGNQLFPFALFPPSAFNPVPDIREFKEDQLIRKLQFSYKASDDIVFYALASEGYRLGGTNQQGVVAVPPGYTSDSLWNYELGAKTTWADGRVNLNVAAFLVDWKDLQVAGRDPTGAFGFIGNAGSAEARGLEVELYAAPTDRWDVTAGFSWLPKRELTEDQISDEVVAPGRKGDKLPFVPGITANATVQYSFPLGIAPDWEGFARGEFAYRGKSDSELNTSSRFNRKQRAYEIVNFRAGVSDDNNGLTVTLFVENVFDKRGDVRVRMEDSLLTVAWTNMPRNIGIDIAKSF